MTADGPAGGVPELVLGPMLRHVDATSATLWFETSGPCTVCVEVGAGELDAPVTASASTWGVHGHHYAILVVRGLPEASELAYSVHLSEVVGGSAAHPPASRRVWPPASPDSELAAFPPSTVRTARSDGRLRLAFGSCRRSEPLDTQGIAEVGPDALVELAHRMAFPPADGPAVEPPDVLLMLGDQLYADEPSAPIRERLRRARRDPDVAGQQEVAEEICTFEEYTWLYTESWSAAPVRWLLSTVPTCMLLDDHDLRDDWNTSQAWREEMARQPWFDDRVRGALGSYWVYQHLGNLSPTELDREELLAAITAADDDDARSALLDAFAEKADADPDTARWSYVRDFGRAGTRGDGEGGDGGGVRLVAVDCRCSRRLEPGNRAILDDAEWEWVQRQAQPDAPVDHLLLASTLPALMVPAFSDVEAWNEALVSGRWGRWLQRPAEVLRQAVDLEHWPAFGSSLHDLLRLIARVADGARPPASVLLLSGDVHCSYTARAQLDGVVGSPTAVHQLVMSPFRNPLKPALRVANRLADKAPVRALAALLARTARVQRPPASWEVEEGPWFDNGVMTVVLDGRSARLEVDHVRVDREGRVLRRTQHRTLV